MSVRVKLSYGAGGALAAALVREDGSMHGAVLAARRATNTALPTGSAVGTQVQPLLASWQQLTGWQQLAAAIAAAGGSALQHALAGSAIHQRDEQALPAALGSSSSQAAATSAPGRVTGKRRSRSTEGMAAAHSVHIPPAVRRRVDGPADQASAAVSAAMAALHPGQRFAFNVAPIGPARNAAAGSIAGAAADGALPRSEPAARQDMGLHRPNMASAAGSSSATVPRAQPGASGTARSVTSMLPPPPRQRVMPDPPARPSPTSRIGRDGKQATPAPEEAAPPAAVRGQVRAAVQEEARHRPRVQVQLHQAKKQGVQVERKAQAAAAIAQFTPVLARVQAEVPASTDATPSRKRAPAGGHRHDAARGAEADAAAFAYEPFGSPQSHRQALHVPLCGPIRHMTTTFTSRTTVVHTPSGAREGGGSGTTTTKTTTRIYSALDPGAAAASLAGVHYGAPAFAVSAHVGSGHARQRASSIDHSLTSPGAPLAALARPLHAALAAAGNDAAGTSNASVSSADSGAHFTIPEADADPDFHLKAAAQLGAGLPPLGLRALSSGSGSDYASMQPPLSPLDRDEDAAGSGGVAAGAASMDDAYEDDAAAWLHNSQPLAADEWALAVAPPDFAQDAGTRAALLRARLESADRYFNDVDVDVIMQGADSCDDGEGSALAAAEAAPAAALAKPVHVVPSAGSPTHGRAALASLGHPLDAHAGRAAQHPPSDGEAFGVGSTDVWLAVLDDADLERECSSGSGSCSGSGAHSGKGSCGGSNSSASDGLHLSWA
jgi:hypothetical protein